MEMQKDTRDRNQNFPTDSMDSFFNGYSAALIDALNSVDKENLRKSASVITFARRSHLRIFSAGNGGSAAIAQHLECDWKKGCFIKNKDSLQIECLSVNVPVITAIGNDLSYEQIFEYQLEMADVRRQEVLVLISSSGNSPNIIKAAQYAKKMGMVTIGLTGFDGGKLKYMADISLHVNANNYGVIEDSHQAIMHALAQWHFLSQQRT